MDYAPIVHDFKVKVGQYVKGQIDFKALLKAKRATRAPHLRKFWGENAILIAIIVENMRGLKSQYSISRHIMAIDALNYNYSTPAQEIARANFEKIDIKKRAAGDYDD